ncbi:MAG TPA: hypothetical protein VMH91_01280 [Candidatus Paceibacterota bacterium]|nr:hypothetical protein [Candidatus Paceibacterota bacterium]
MNTALALPFQTTPKTPSFARRIFSWVDNYRASLAERKAKRLESALVYARRSAEALEREVPGSVARLDPKALKIESDRACALAQVFGNFYDAPEKLRYGPVGVGFTVPISLDNRSMNLAWRMVIDSYRLMAKAA